MSKYRYSFAFVLTLIIFILLSFSFITLAKKIKEPDKTTPKIIKIALISPLLKNLKNKSTQSNQFIAPAVMVPPIIRKNDNTQNNNIQKSIVNAHRPKKIVKKKIDHKPKNRQLIKKKSIRHSKHRKITKKKVVHKPKPKKIVKKKIVHKHNPKKIVKKKIVHKPKPKKIVKKKIAHKPKPKKIVKKKIVHKPKPQRIVKKKIIHKSKPKQHNVVKKRVTHHYKPKPKPIIRERVIERPKPKPVVQEEIIEEYIPPKIVKERVIKRHEPEKVIYPKAVPLEREFVGESDRMGTDSFEYISYVDREEKIESYSPPPPVIAPQPVVDKSAEKRRFLTQIRRDIIGNKQYPRVALRRHIQGSVKVKFDITSRGTVSNIQFINGKRILQKGVRDAIEKSFPISIPNSLRSELPIHNIYITIHFNIN